MSSADNSTDPIVCEVVLETNDCSQKLQCLGYWWSETPISLVILAAIMVLFAAFLPKIIVRFIFFTLARVKYVRRIVDDFAKYCTQSTTHLVRASLIWGAIGVAKLDAYLCKIPLYLYGLFILPWLYSFFKVIECFCVRRWGGYSDQFSKRVVITESVKLLRLMVIMIIAAMIYLQIFEEQKDSLTYSIFGMVGLAVAIGSVPACHNALGGLYLVFHAPFKVGDVIEIDSGGSTAASGTVQRVALRYTVLLTSTGTTTFVPNSYFLISPMINYSQRPKRQVEIHIELYPDTPVKLIRDFMIEAEAVLQTLHTGLTSHRLNLVDARTLNEEVGDGGNAALSTSTDLRFFFVAMDELYKIRVYSYTEDLDPKKHALIKSEVWLALAEVMEDLGIQQKPSRKYLSSSEQQQPYLPTKTDPSAAMDFTTFNR